MNKIKLSTTKKPPQKTVATLFINLVSTNLAAEYMGRHFMWKRHIHCKENQNNRCTENL